MHYREDLDKVVAGGCKRAGCAHRHDDEPMRLTPKCHLGAPLNVAYQGGKLSVICRTCGSSVVEVAVASRADQARAN